MSRWRGSLLACVLFGCGGDPEPAVEAVVAERSESPAPAPEPAVDPIQVVPDCKALALSAERSDDDLALLPMLCPGLHLDHPQLRRVLLSVGSAAQASTMIAALDHDAELQGLVRLSILDRA